MATQALAYGIDFGTSNSAIAVAYPDRVELVELGPQAALTLPSFVYLNRGGSQGAGEEAARLFLESGHQRTGCNECSLAPYGADTECRQYRRGGGCNDARLLAGVKHDLARIGFAGTNSWATDFSVADLVAVVIRRLKTEADASTETDVRRLVLGHPVVFSGTDQAAPGASRAEALRRLGEAARVAGFEDVDLLPEPTAALMGEAVKSGIELAVDFGGGTFDVAVLDSRSGTPVVAGLGGVPIGGEGLDGVLFETLIGPALELHRLPNWLYNQMRTASSVRLLMADPGVPEVLARVGGPASEVARILLYKGHAYAFYKAIERTKVLLSTQDHVRLRYPPVGLDLTVGRSAFESMIGPELDRIVEVITGSLASAGVEPAKVNRILLTGGSSQIPAFRRRLLDLFDADRLEQRDAFTAVVHGLGVFAQNKAW